MSDLQLALIGLGAVVMLAVVIYNIVQERRARKRAETAFGLDAADALFDGAPERKSVPVEGDRREPTLGSLPPSDIVEAAEALGATPVGEEGESLGGPAAEISNRIDSVALIVADEPITSEQLQPLVEALQALPAGARLEGLVDEQWHPVATSPRRSWRELRAGLQLASRKGPVDEADIERFNHTVADFAAAVHAISQREASSTAAARAKDLDGFCADADIEVAVNVVGKLGATFSVARVKSLALEGGLSETASGELIRFTREGVPGFAIRRFDSGDKAQHAYYTGVSFALDVPHVADAPRMLAEMVHLAKTYAMTLGGELVDDNRKPLTDSGIASIRRSLEGVMADMRSRGIPPGGSLAQRLFS